MQPDPVFVQVRWSRDTDRLWLFVSARGDVAFIRRETLERLSAPSDFGPVELVPVVTVAVSEELGAPPPQHPHEGP